MTTPGTNISNGVTLNAFSIASNLSVKFGFPSTFKLNPIIVNIINVNINVGIVVIVIYLM